MREASGPLSPLPLATSLPLTSRIFPPQAKLNLSVRALESSAPNLQVAAKMGRLGWSRWASEGGSTNSWLGTVVLSCSTGEGVGVEMGRKWRLGDGKSLRTSIFGL